jgi:hypothetical protein
MQLDPLYIIAQAFGAIGFLINAFGMTRTDDRQLKMCVAIAAMAFAIQFYLLGAMLGAFLACIGAVRYWLASRTKNKYLMWFFIIFYIAMAFINQEGLPGLLLLAGSLIGTYALFRLDGANMRYAFIAGCLCIISYDIYYLAFGSLANNLLALILHVSTIYRIKRKQLTK